MTKDNYHVTYDVSGDLKNILTDIAASLRDISKKGVKSSISLDSDIVSAIEDIGNGVLNVGKNTFSPNVSDSNMEPANLVDVLNYISNSIRFHAKTIEKIIPKGDTNEI